MGSRFHPRLATWFDEGLACGKFDVPSGRHIILNEFPRLMPESRLLASAGVDRTSLHEFLLTVNPNVISIPDGSTEGMRQQLALECDQLPGLRKVFTRLPPSESYEAWYVYTPPLASMRQGWQTVRFQFGLSAAMHSDT